MNPTKTRRKPDGPTVSILRASELLGWDKDATYALVKAGTFPVPLIQKGSRQVVPTAALMRLIETGQAA